MNKKIIKFIGIVLAVSCINYHTAEAEWNYKRTTEKYDIPDVVLVNQEGKKIHFAELMRSNKPVIVDFIFATCTTICPLLSTGFTNLQVKLGANSQNVQLVSISIDPEHDTPKVMKEYLKRYRARPGWDFLTGKRSDIDKVMYAFNAYVPDKMSHIPLNLIKTPGDSKWIRYFGLMGSTEFVSECQKVGIK